MLVYSANNVNSLGSDPEPVAGSYKLIPELKALAPHTEGSKVAIATQGYERLTGGRWETRRYEVVGGESQDLTSSIPGGSAASMFSPEVLHDFLRDSMKRYPQAKKVVLFVNAHGHPGPLLGGEKIVEGELRPWEHEQIGIKQVGDVLAAVADETGARIALLDLNCCEMGKAENYLELGPNADFMLASPQNEFVPKGHEYTAAFQDIVGACQALIQDSDMTAEELGRHLIRQTTQKTTFEERGRVENPIPTLDLFRMSALPELAQGLDGLGRELSELLKSEEGKERVLKAVGEATRYRDRVVDLHSFLESVGMTGLEKTLKEMTVTSFRGSFRGRDYSETRPMAAFLPELPPVEKMVVPVASAAGDVRPLLSRVIGPRESSNPRRWAVKLAGDLSDLRARLEFDYPAMLEVLPEPSLEGALDQGPEHETLVALEQEVMSLMSVLQPGDPRIEEITARVQTSLKPLSLALAQVKVGPWVERFQALGGRERLVQAAQQRKLDQIRTQMNEPVFQLEGLNELPSGWKKFLSELTEVILQERWVPKIRSEVV